MRKVKKFNKELAEEMLAKELAPWEINALGSKAAFTDKEIAAMEKHKPYLLATHEREDIRDIINTGFQVMTKEFSIELLSRRFAFYEGVVTGDIVDTPHDLRLRSLRSRDCLMNGYYFDTLKEIRGKSDA